MNDLDLSNFVQVTVPYDRSANVQAVAYCDERERNGIMGDNAGSIRLFMLLSLFPHDHAVIYLFFHGAPTVEQVKAFAELNKEGFGYRLVVVEMGQALETLEAAALEADTLREAFPRANIMFPPATLAEPTAPR